MVTRWFFSIVVLICLGTWATAQNRGDLRGGALENIPDTLVNSVARPVTSNLFESLHRNYYSPGELWFASQSPFAFANAFGWQEALPVGFLPETDVAPAPVRTAVATPARPDQFKLGALFPQIDYAGGEVSFFYGKSLDGRFDRELKGGYILGEISSGNTQINVGAWYSHDRISR